MEDERHAIVTSVAGAFQSSPHCFDLVMSAFSQALHSRRRSSVCTPFPSSIFTTRHGDKDFDAVEAALWEVSKLLLDGCSTRLGCLSNSADLVNCFTKLPLESLKLMQWLWRFRYKVHLVASHELPNELIGKFLEPQQSTAVLSGLIPDYILKFEESDSRQCTAFEEIRSQFGSIFAFHGTPAENLHSILRCGLLILSNSSLQQNGAIYGEGIYLSSDPAVALGFSKAGMGWECSSFGQRARYLLLCEVAKGEQVLCSENHKPKSLLRKQEKDLGTYIIVQNSDLIKVRYIFVYAEPCSKGVEVKKELPLSQDHLVKPYGFPSLKRINWCKAFIIFYVALLIGIASLNSPSTSKFASKLRRR